MESKATVERFVIFKAALNQKVVNVAQIMVVTAVFKVN